MDTPRMVQTPRRSHGGGVVVGGHGAPAFAPPPFYGTLVRLCAAPTERRLSGMVSVECCACSDALSHDHGGVRCTSDPPHHLCGDCSISFCSSKLMALSSFSIAFPPACSKCSKPVTLASFDAHLNAEGYYARRDDFVPQDGGEEEEEEEEEEEGLTELMGAAADGDTGSVVALLAAPGLDVNAAAGEGSTALMLAARGGHTETVTALLAAPGLDVNAAADDGTTALMEAARGGHTETVTVLLAAPGLDVYVLNSAGRMALTLADEQGHVAIASLLRARRRRSQSSRA